MILSSSSCIWNLRVTSRHGMYGCVLELSLGDDGLQNCDMLAAYKYLFVL